MCVWGGALRVRLANGAISSAQTMAGLEMSAYSVNQTVHEEARFKKQTNKKRPHNILVK